jgi:hypothetical protein
MQTSLNLAKVKGATAEQPTIIVAITVLDAPFPSNNAMNDCPVSLPSRV